MLSPFFVRSREWQKERVAVFPGCVVNVLGVEGVIPSSNSGPCVDSATLETLPNPQMTELFLAG